MAGEYDINIDTSPQLQYEQYQITVSQTIIPQVITGTVQITTINGGGGGQVTGPTITISGGTTGLNFVGTGDSITLNGTLVVANGGTGATTAAGARSNLSAAKSGSNADITDFTGLTGNTGFGADTGTADKTSHATYPATTASVGYVQAESQGLMDKMKAVTEEVKAIKDALLAWGGLET